MPSSTSSRQASACCLFRIGQFGGYVLRPSKLPLLATDAPRTMHDHVRRFPLILRCGSGTPAVALHFRQGAHYDARCNTRPKMPPSIRRGRRRLLCLLLLLPALLLALNTLIARRLLSASTVANQIISGRIVGQPVAFAHSVLRRRQLPTSQNIARNESVAVAIVGGGVAGLVAAWTLKLKGIDAIVLEHEEQPGGNARWARTGPAASSIRGARITYPSRRAACAPLRAFFEALGLLLPRPTEWASVGSKGEWMVEDAANAQELHGDVAPGVPTCKEPTERLYYPPESPMQSSSFVGWRDGTDGVVPYERMSADDVSQLKRFRAIVKSEATRQTADGKRPSHCRSPTARAIHTRSILMRRR